MKCFKSQQVLHRDKDGCHEYTKCINLMSTNFAQEVTEQICDTCVLKQTGPCRTNCMNPRPRNTTYTEPRLENGIIKYTEENPPTPEGHEVVEDGFKSIWPDCPGLLTNNTLNSDGSLRVLMVCDLLKKEVSFESCTKCFKQMSEKFEAEKQAEKQVEQQANIVEPSLAKKVQHYSQAIYTWVKEGMESRTDAEVEEILNTHCKQCSLYDSSKHICKKCGCQIQLGGVAITNKLKMKSEHCPLGKW